MKEVAGRMAPVGLALDVRQQLQAGISVTFEYFINFTFFVFFFLRKTE